MAKTILITGATDGLGLATAKRLAADGHHLLLHGRNSEKLRLAEGSLKGFSPKVTITCYQADLSDPKQVLAFITAVESRHDALDVIINNAGVFTVPASHSTQQNSTVTPDGIDLRVAVNTLAPYLITKGLWRRLRPNGRIVNVASAAQAPLNLAALRGELTLADHFNAYAQSKLALIMWTRHLAQIVNHTGGPQLFAINPGSYLATKMVKDGFNTDGRDINTGALILQEAAVGERFASANGEYFDNDQGGFAAPHAEARNVQRCAELVEILERL